MWLPHFPFVFITGQKNPQTLSSLVLRKQFEMQFLCCRWPALSLRGASELQGERLLPAEEHHPLTAQHAPKCFWYYLQTWRAQQSPEQRCARDVPSPSRASITCLLRCCHGGRWRKHLPAFEAFVGESKLTSLWAVQANLMCDLLCLPHLQAIICTYLSWYLAGGRQNAQRWGNSLSRKEEILADTSGSIDVPLDKTEARGTAWGPGTGYTLNSNCAQRRRYVLIQSFRCRAPFRYKEPIYCRASTAS